MRHLLLPLPREEGSHRPCDSAPGPSSEGPDEISPTIIGGADQVRRGEVALGEDVGLLVQLKRSAQESLRADRMIFLRYPPLEGEHRW